MIDHIVSQKTKLWVYFTLNFLVVFLSSFISIRAVAFFLLYIFFFFPGMLALVWFGYEIASDSWRYKEVSWNSPARIQIYFFKSLIPLAGGLLILQGISESMRCILCIRNGTWMKRHEDVRETEEDLIKQQQEELRRKKG